MGQDYLNYKLSRSDSWLIQKGTFKNRHTFDETTNQLYPFPILNGITGFPPFPGIYYIIDVNYKGISKFEKDAIRNSIRRMVVNIDFYDFYKIPDIKNSENKSIIIYGPVMFKKHIENQVRLLASNKIETKEATGLDSYILNHECFYNANFWWDTVNDFYIFFDETKMDLIENA